MKENAMTARLDPFGEAPALMQAWLDFGKIVPEGGLEESMMELLKIRASQINGRAACLRMHTAAARQKGETEERLYLLDAWRESPFYTPRERAALAWTEALPLLQETRLRRTSRSGQGGAWTSCAGLESCPTFVTMSNYRA